MQQSERLISLEKDMEQVMDFIDKHPEVHEQLEAELMSYHEDTVEHRHQISKLLELTAAINAKVHEKKHFWSLETIKDIFYLLAMIGCVWTFTLDKQTQQQQLVDQVQQIQAAVHSPGGK